MRNAGLEIKCNARNCIHPELDDARHLVAGVVLGELGFAEAKEEGGTALGLDWEKVFSPCGVSSGVCEMMSSTVLLP